MIHSARAHRHLLRPIRTATFRPGRWEARYPLRGEVLITPLEDPLGRFWAMLQDISLGGLYLLAEVALPVYTRLDLRVVPRDAPPFRVRARVAHVRPGVGFGCAFTELTPRSRQQLMRWAGQGGGPRSRSGIIETRPVAREGVSRGERCADRSSDRRGRSP